MEFVLRREGFQSGPHDDDTFWAYHRLAVDSLGEDGIVCLGSSRCQADVNAQRLGERLQRPVIQLGIAGSSPLPVLEDIAKRSAYRGLILLSISPQHSFSDSVERTSKSHDWIARYRECKSSPGEQVELRLKIAARDLVVLRQDFNWRTVVNRYLLSGESADKEIWTQSTRWTRFPDEMKRKRRSVKVEIPEIDREPIAREQLIKRFANAIEAIRRRGGRVMIVRPPSTGPDYEALGLNDTEKKFMPRIEFYDRLVSVCNVPSFHAEDIDGLKQLFGADGSHLCESDAQIYTDWLAKTIQSLTSA